MTDMAQHGARASGPLSSGPVSAGAGLRLRLLATSDLHGHLLPWDDLTDRPAPGIGLAQVASLIAEARAEVPNSLLLDNGDFLTGSPLTEFLAHDPHWSAAENPVIAAMNHLGYDAATLGNHEFSLGLAHLRRALRGARFPVVSANTLRVATSRRRRLVPGYTLLQRDCCDGAGQVHRLKIAVLGVLPPQTALWERLTLAGRLEVDDMLPHLRRTLQAARRQGADVVVVLAHTGLGAEGGSARQENVAHLIRALPGVDAVIAGHTHQTLAAPAEPGRPPLVMPGFNGSHLGVIDLDLMQRPGGGWQVAGHAVALRAVACRDATGALRPRVATAAPVAAIAAPGHAAYRRHAARVVAQASCALHSHFALLGESPVDSLLAEAQVAAVRLALAGGRFDGLPVVAAVAPFRCGGRGGPENYVDIPAGPLTVRHVAELYIHPNRLVALCLTGAEIAAWLERAVSLFAPLPPGAQDVALIRPDFPSYNFDMLHGLTHHVDLAQQARHDATGAVVAPGARRIGDLRLAGLPLAPTDRVIVATNSYRASGGAGFAGADAAHVVLEHPRLLRDVVMDHLERSSPLCPAPRAGWHLVAPPGTSALLDSAAAARPADCSHRLEPLGLQASGFQRFRLRF